MADSTNTSGAQRDCCTCLCWPDALPFARCRNCCYYKELVVQNYIFCAWSFSLPFAKSKCTKKIILHKTWKKNLIQIQYYVHVPTCIFKRFFWNVYFRSLHGWDTQIRHLIQSFIPYLTRNFGTLFKESFLKWESRSTTFFIFKMEVPQIIISQMLFKGDEKYILT